MLPASCSASLLRAAASRAIFAASLLRTRTFQSLPVIDVSPLVDPAKARSSGSPAVGACMPVWARTQQASQAATALAPLQAHLAGQVARQLDDACTNVGFFYIRGHGQPASHHCRCRALPPAGRRPSQQPAAHPRPALRPSALAGVPEEVCTGVLRHARRWFELPVRALATHLAAGRGWACRRRWAV
jgi:hypothetical protein